MDHTDIIKGTDVEKFGRSFLEQFLARGVGSMSKRDIDVLVLHLLEEHASLDLKSNHELSLALRLAESRVRGLRYEGRLKYPSNETKFLERRLLFVLARAQYDVDGRRILFVIEDSFVRTSLQAHLKRTGAIADTSFNSEIVKVRMDHLFPVLEDLYGKQVAQPFVDQMKKEATKDEFVAARKNFVLAVAKAFGSGVVTLARTALTGGAA